MSKDGDIKKFVENYQITFPVGKENGISEILGVKGIPTTLFISRSGRIVKRHIGEIDNAELIKNIEALLN